MSLQKSSYLALGDSYTIGEGVKEKERWPVQLAKHLDWQKPEIIAATGWTTAELLEGIANSQLQSAYDWVSLLIGVNNQYRGQPLEDYQEDLNHLAEIMLPLVQHQAEKVFVVSIPDYGITPFAKGRNPQKISDELVQFNQANQSFAHHYGFQYSDIWPESLLAKDKLNLLADDQLHPSGKMYELWTRKIIATCSFV